MQQIEVKSLNDVDLSELKFPMIVIYDHPTDIPNKFVARIWDFNNPTNVYMAKDSLEEIRENIPAYMTRFNRNIDDDKCIIETWF